MVKEVTKKLKYKGNQVRRVPYYLSLNSLPYVGLLNIYRVPDGTPELLLMAFSTNIYALKGPEEPE